METVPFLGWAVGSLLLSLRIAPVLTFAPPFTLTRIPPLFRALLALGLAGSMAAGYPAATAVTDFSAGALAATALRELFLGSLFALVFQLMFAALYLAGRTIDVQAGFGLAGLVDPTTQNQTPLVGALFALAAGAIFFAANGHHDLLRIIAASLETIPLGAGQVPVSLPRLTGFISVIFLTGFGVGGGVILALFLTDVAIAFLTRTAPQMNALMLGFQVKTLLLFVALPITLGTAAALLARMAAMTLEALPRLLA